MYNTQIMTEIVQGRHNIMEWVKEEIASIRQSDIDLALARAELFLSKDRTEDLESKARIEEISLMYGLEEAKQLLVDSLLTAIVLIKPEILIRGGKEVAYPGVAPIQAIATTIGLALHYDQVDAVQTGIEILAEFEDLGIFDVRVVKEEDRAVNRGAHIEVHGDSAVVIPTMAISIDLYKRINLTRYLPPSLVAPANYTRN